MKCLTGGIIVAALSATLIGCTSSDENSPAELPVIEHVHGIVQNPNSDDVLIASHNGIFSIAPDGTATGPVGDYDFDAMGFTELDGILFASGHPGLETPTELGSPNLGIIRSDDLGETWTPVSLTNVEDFHVLTSGPDGFLYGIGSSSPNIVVSRDEGLTWEPQGAISAVALAISDRGMYAATEQGVQVSTDNGSSFSVLSEAPFLYQLAATPSGVIIGVDVDGYLWSLPLEGDWTKGEQVSGQVQALGVSDSELPILVDDRGVVEISAEGATVLSPVNR